MSLKFVVIVIVASLLLNSFQLIVAGSSFTSNLDDLIKQIWNIHVEDNIFVATVN